MNDVSFAFVGGVLITILSHFKQNSHIDSRGYSIPVRDADLFKAYMEAIKGAPIENINEGTLKKVVSHYKGCRQENSSLLVMEDQTIVGNYDYEIRTEDGYSLLVERMTKFLRGYIDVSKKEVLVKAIMEQIRYDSSIKSSQHFYIDGYVFPVTKMQLLNKNAFSLPEFMVGVTHYVLMNCGGRNAEGAETLDIIAPLMENKKRDLNRYAFGKRISQYVKVLFPELKSATETIIKTIDSKQSTDAMPALDAALANCLSNVSAIPLTVSDSGSVNFSDIFVPLNLAPHSNRATDSKRCIENPTVKMLCDMRPHHILMGMGGSGKTMMETGFLFQLAGEYPKTGYYPVYINLREYTGEDDTLMSFVTRELRSYCERITGKEIQKKLEDGDLCLLLDGLDELPKENKGKFSDQMGKFRRQNPQIAIIMSTRNADDISGFDTFAKWDCQNLTLEQAEKLLDKYPDITDSRTKRRFVIDLYNGLYNKFPNFAGNPLLLLVMLLVYNSNNGMPDITCEFYDEAIRMLFKSHDESKPGFKRHFYTSLRLDEYKRLFSKFCLITYDKKVSIFREEAFCEYMSIALQGESISTGAKPIDFLYDAVYILGILYKSGNAYYFLHDTFQQYFAAYYLSEHWDRRKDYLSYFDVRDSSAFYDDHTLDFLYDMRRLDIEADVFYPRFKALLNDFEQSENPYWAFLEHFYPVIEISILPDSEDMEANSNAYRRILSMSIEPVHSSSYIYDTFMRINRMSKARNLMSCEWPDSVWRACSGELFYWDADYDSAYDYPVLLSDQQVIHEMDLSEAFDTYDHGEENYAGLHLIIRPSSISTETDSGIELIDLMTEDDFPLMDEFWLFQNWIHDQDKLRKGTGNGTSLTDLFGIDMTKKRST